MVDGSAPAPTVLDEGLVDRWLTHRNDVSALAPLWRAGVVVDTVEVSARWSALPGLYDAVLDALAGVPGTLVASSHQSHAYTDGACLYFTFAGRPPEDLAAEGVGNDGRDAWVADYYRRAWDEVTRATMAAGGAISHHHGIGLNRGRFLADALGGAFDVLASVKPALDPHGILNPGKLGLPTRLRRGALAMSILVVDVGTSGVRGAVVRPDAAVEHVHHVPGPARHARSPAWSSSTARPSPRPSLEVAAAQPGRRRPGGRRSGIANQRASTLVWDRATGEPVGPGLGWQDLRTVGTCLELQAEGIRLAPNASATKLAAILDHVDPDRARAERGDLAFGTIDTWVAWILSGGALHVTDASNAGVTGLIHGDGTELERAAARGAPHPRGRASHHRRLVGGPRHGHRRSPAPRRSPGWPATSRPRSSARAAPAPARPRPPSAPGACSTSASGTDRPPQAVRGPAGTIPIIAWRRNGSDTWGIEAIMLSAGTCVEWLRDDLGIIDDAARARPPWPPDATTPATSGSCPPSSAWARRSGTSAPGGRSPA